MTMDREALEDSLEAYALHSLDESERSEVERALAVHPDLRARVERMQSMLSLLADGEEVPPPPSLRSGALQAAVGRRPPGRAIDDPASAHPVRCYRATADDLAALIGTLGPDDLGAVTLYGSTVAELLAHLCAVERYCHAVLRGVPFDGELPDGHRALVDTTVPATDPAALAAHWEAGRELVSTVAGELPASDLETTVTFHGLTLRRRQLLVARAFELWTHGEDIADALGRGEHRLPEPAVLRTMADTATELVGSLLASMPDRAGASVRITLTGPGGGSWVRIIDPADSTETSDPALVADATLVADVVDFCHLVANRIDPATGLDATRQGDDALLDDLLTMLPTLAEYGDRRLR